MPSASTLGDGLGFAVELADELGDEPGVLDGVELGFAVELEDGLGVELGLALSSTIEPPVPPLRVSGWSFCNAL